MSPGSTSRSTISSAFTYHGATNNAATVTYREGGATGTIVATVTFTYTTQPPTVDNTPLATVTRS
jgi:hypothetical protein